MLFPSTLSSFSISQFYFTFSFLAFFHDYSSVFLGHATVRIGVDDLEAEIEVVSVTVNAEKSDASIAEDMGISKGTVREEKVVLVLFVEVEAEAEVEVDPAASPEVETDTMIWIEGVWEAVVATAEKPEDTEAGRDRNRTSARFPMRAEAVEVAKDAPSTWARMVTSEIEVDPSPVDSFPTMAEKAGICLQDNPTVMTEDMIE